MKGNRVVSELPKDRQDKKRARIHPAPLRFRKPDLVFDCQGHGWFDADCDIIVTKES